MNNFTFQGSLANSVMNSPPSNPRQDPHWSKYLESEKDSGRHTNTDQELAVFGGHPAKVQEFALQSGDGQSSDRHHKSGIVE